MPLNANFLHRERLVAALSSSFIRGLGASQRDRPTMDAVMAHHRKVPRTASYHWIKERSAALMKEINYIALMRDACSSGQVSNPQSTYPEASPETGLCRTSLLHTCRPLFSPSAIAMQPPAVATHSQQQHTKRRSLEQVTTASHLKTSDERDDT